MFDFGPTGQRFESARAGTLSLSPSGEWIIKGLAIPRRVLHVCVTGHMRKYPVPLIEKSRASCPGGRFPHSFIHQVISITGLNKLYDCMFSTSRLICF